MLSLCATLALVTVVMVASGARCPERCSCGVGDELEYSCQLAGANLTLTARLMDYGNIDCEGGTLTCSDFPSVPIAGNRTLQSLAIRDCSLPDPLSCIARRLDASGVEKLVLNNVLTPLEGRHLEGLGSGVVSMFNAEVQTSVPSEALSSLPSLYHFRLCGGDVTFTGRDFLQSPPLTYLELADHISSLPADSFQGLDQLKVLSLRGNNITYVDEDALRGLSSLKDLYISTSSIRALPPRVLSHAPSLSTLTLVRNLLSSLPNELFKGLTQLKQVSISNDVSLSLDPLVFSNLTLTSLSLERASLSTLPPHVLLHTTTLLNLTLAHNLLSHIPRETFDSLTSLEKLDLSYNRIANISNQVFLGLKALKELKMDGNLIEELPEQLFTGLRHLESLSISSNRLHTIHPDTFQGSSLVHVSLSHNSLSLSPPPTAPHYYSLQQYSPFNNLLKLKTLDLSRNVISTIFDDWRNVLLDLMQLDLKYNSFVELNEADVQFLSSKIVVDLRHNNISTLLLSLGDRHAHQHAHQHDNTHASVLLAHNPLTCDCRLYALATRLKGARPLTVEPLFDLNETYCASPLHLQRVQFSQVPLKDFICDVECPCQCQIWPDMDTLNVNCFNDSSVPDPREYGLSYTMLKLRESPENFTALPDYVTVLNLSGIGLKTAPEYVPKSLELLDLTNNKLEEFPVELLNRNLSLKLSGNAFLCECSAVDEISLMNTFNSKIIDWEHVKCEDGSLLWRIEVEKLCLVQRAAVLGGLLATCGVLLAVVAMLVHRYSIEIKIFLTNRGLVCGGDEYDSTKQYDVFVSFAHTDETFVIDKLLPKLEANYKVCVHHRDWRVGDLIPAQIARSVEESRRTLIVLSRNFLASTWGMLEFRAAHVQAAKENKVRVIVLLLEELADVEIDRELRAYLTTNTYIKWGDPWFWEKMQYSLPRRTRAKDVRSERRAKLAADNMARGGLHVTLTADGKLVNNANKHVI